MTTRHNLLPDSSFRTLEPWEGVNNARLSKHSTDSVQGGSSLRVRLSTDSGPGVRSGQAEVSPLLPYAASAYVAVPSVPSSAGSVYLAVQMVWRNATGTVVSTSSSPGLAVRVTDGWIRLSHVADAPTTARTVEFQIVHLGTATTDHYFLVDAALLEQSSFVGGWVDSTSSDNKTTVLNKALTKPSAHPVEGLPLRADVMIDDLVLNTIDEDDTLWVCTDIDGWWGTAAPEFPSVNRGTDDGDFDVPGRFEARIMTIKGVFFPSDVQYLQRARDRLVNATNLVRRGAWFRTNEDPTKAAFVRLSGQVKMETVNAKGKTEFSIGLKAADPIRYGWNDNDLLGYTTVSLPARSNESLIITNDGTASVNGIIELTGPIGGGSSISNRRTGESLRLLGALRGAKPVGTVLSSFVRDGRAVLTLSDPPEIVEGDLIHVVGLGHPYDTGIDPATAVSVSSWFAPYTVAYEVDSHNLPSIPASPQAAVRLARNDVLSIDTYHKSVTLNGVSVGNRSRIDTLVDWIQFMPGENELVLDDARNKLRLYKRGWSMDREGTIQTENPHYLSVNDKVTISIPDTVELSTKQLTNNVVTLTTKEPHGFIKGEKIDVVTTEFANITHKEATAGVVTLTTDVPGEFGVGDSIRVDLPTDATIVAKSASSTQVTLTASGVHGFSNGDSITVTLPTTAQASSRSRSGNVATITTAATHNFSVGDRVSIVLPSTTSITQKTISSTSVTLTTNTAHGFSSGDLVTIPAATTATLTGARSTSGNSALTATITTAQAHGFDAGDLITVGIGVTPARTVTTRSATSTQATLTLGTHNFAVGEIVEVTGLGERFDGRRQIVSMTATTIVYDAPGAVVASAAAATGALATNVTIRDGYNGQKVIESVTATTITYFAGISAPAASSGAGGTGHTLVNNTNLLVAGTKTLTSVPSSTQMTFSRS